MAKKGKRKLSSWQVHVKSVMAKNPNLSFKQALRKAKQSYKASSGTKRSSKPRRRSNPRRVKTKVRKLARKKRKGGGKSLQRTVFKWIRVGTLVAPGAARAARIIQAEGTKSALRAGAEALTMYGGYRDEKFDPMVLVEAWAPFLAATLTTYGIPKLAGIIRKI